MFTAYGEWVNFFRFHHKQSDPRPEDSAAALKKEMEDEFEIVQKSSMEAEALFEAISIFDERIAAHEDLRAFIEISDIKSINMRLSGHQFKSKEEVLLQYLPGIELVVHCYKNTKDFCCMHTDNPLLLEFVYDMVLGMYNAASRVKNQEKMNPEYDFFHLDRIRRKLEPFLSAGHAEFQKKFSHSKSLIYNTAPQHFLMLKQDAERLQRSIEQLKKTTIEHKGYLSTNYRAEVLSALENISSYTVGPFPLSEKRDDIEIAFDSSKKLRQMFYAIREKFLELERIEAEVTETARNAKFLQEQKFAQKQTPQKLERSLSESSSDASITSLATQTVKPKNAKSAASIEHEAEQKKPETKEKPANELQEKETAHLKLMQKKILDWHAERELALREYKKYIQERRDIKAKIVENRISLIKEELKSSEQNADETLKPFEIEQLLFLDQHVPKLSEFLSKLSARQLKYSELESFIKKLSERLIDPAKHSHFNLIYPGAHFVMHLPNTRKFWTKTEKGYELMPRQMSTLNSWKGQDGKHNIDELGNWAVERCEMAFIRAGITSERLERAFNQRVGKIAFTTSI